jgi:hypothetical protein
VVRVAGIKRKQDFEAEICLLADLRKKILDNLQGALAKHKSDGTASLQKCQRWIDDLGGARALSSIRQLGGRHFERHFFKDADERTVLLDA